MAQVTLFCVQPFLSAGGGVQAGRLWRFTSAVDAEEAVKLLKSRVAGGLHYEIEGDPEFEIWDEPVLLDNWGQLPDDLVRSLTPAAA